VTDPKDRWTGPQDAEKRRQNNLFVRRGVASNTRQHIAELLSKLTE
jgi:hypothetical protein